ncbi:MAG TPA: DsbC family protein [Azospira sp.]|nr:DsbC family protein [Azospira sp.]
MQQLKKLAALLCTGLLFALPAQADEASIKKAVEEKINAKVESVTKSGYLGLYEVFTDGQILYTDEKVTVLLVGTLVDAKTMQNVTGERMKKLTAVKFSELPLELAVKQVKGNGKRTLVTFEDPNCGYCKRLAKDLQKLDNVTIYTFLYPILSADSMEKSKQVWCAKDQVGAWSEMMGSGKPFTGRTDCDTGPVQKSYELGRRLNITGTPTLFFADGERFPGAVPLEKIEQKLKTLNK